MKLWIARDKSGNICLFRTTPMLLSSGVFITYDDDDYWILDSSEYPEVTFENSPQEVEIKLAKET